MNRGLDREATALGQAGFERSTDNVLSGIQLGGTLLDACHRGVFGERLKPTRRHPCVLCGISLMILVECRELVLVVRGNAGGTLDSLFRTIAQPVETSELRAVTKMKASNRIGRL